MPDPVKAVPTRDAPGPAKKLLLFTEYDPPGPDKLADPSNKVPEKPEMDPLPLDAPEPKGPVIFTPSAQVPLEVPKLTAIVEFVISAVVHPVAHAAVAPNAV